MIQRLAVAADSLRRVMVNPDIRRALLAWMLGYAGEWSWLVALWVYAYQTSAKGWYAAEAPHVSGNSGDYRFARLFTHGVTDADGRCELVTVHPTGYPRSDLPSHIHLLLEGRAGDQRGTEIRFEDCPRMTAAAHADSLRAGFVVVPVEKLADGGARCTAEFTLPA